MQTIVTDFSLFIYCGDTKWPKHETDQFLNTKVSQSTVAMCLKCDGGFNNLFVKQSLLSSTMKGFWKLVNICQSYGQESSVLFFDSRGIWFWLIIFTVSYTQNRVLSHKNDQWINEYWNNLKQCMWLCWIVSFAKGSLNGDWHKPVMTVEICQLNKSQEYARLLKL